MKFLSTIPAYGRDYKHGKDVQADWEAGKDFYIVPQPPDFRGGYVNKDDKPADVQLNIRYRDQTMVWVIYAETKA